MNLKVKRLTDVFLTFVLLLPFYLHGQITFVLDDYPSNTPSNNYIYIAGNFNNWQPNNVDYRVLKNRATGKMEVIVTPTSNGLVKYKFSRGSWDNSEGNLTGGKLEDRTLNYLGKPVKVPINIASWIDLPISNKSTAANNVQLLPKTFTVPYLKTQKKVWVYLPPNYDSTHLEYPVIYMQDGEQLFDIQTSGLSKEWGVDESLNWLFDFEEKGVIIVGIESDSKKRIEEYAPWKNAQGEGGGGVHYARFLTDILKPYIDDHYRTMSAANTTGIIGSGQGGLFALYAGLEYPHIFGKIGAFSPTFWYSIDAYKFVKEKGRRKPSKIYLLAGVKEGESAINGTIQMYNILRNVGFSTKEVIKVIEKEGEANNEFWGKSFSAAYEWLFEEIAPQERPTESKLKSSSTKQPSNPPTVANSPTATPFAAPYNEALSLQLLPNYQEKTLTIESNKPLKDLNIRVFSETGELLTTYPNLNKGIINLKVFRRQKVVVFDIYYKTTFVTRKTIVVS